MSKRGNQSKTEEELSVLEAELRAQPLVLPDRRYSVVVLDPPWPMRKIFLAGTRRNSSASTTLR